MNVFIFNQSLVNDEIIERVKNEYPKRYAKALEYKNEKDFRLSIAASFLLIKCLPSLKEEEILYNEFGKPDSFNIHFSISHSGDYSVLVYDKGSVGIDIEKIDKKHIHIKNRIYTSKELEWLKEDEENRFFILWTMKESILKLIGKGLTLSLGELDVLGLIDNKELVVNGFKVYSKNIKFNDYFISLSKDSNIDSINLFEIK